MDVHTPQQRSHNMRRIRDRDTKPELIIRRGLHARGYRYRLHSSLVPGRPDISFPKRQVVVFVHGCFWHGHDCPLFKMPASRTEFWNAKIGANRLRDKKVADEIANIGWRRITIWECALRGQNRLAINEVLDRCEDFIADTRASQYEIAGSKLE